ncbi:MAG TPA: tripartite tricarboxylate transporter substrate binding protein [Burkholderiaceae bacterium]|nr:tripartite tricarboxylate transporter substrate binding protein [Burkholderiaceae bacterium]
MHTIKLLMCLRWLKQMHVMVVLFTLPSLLWAQPIYPSHNVTIVVPSAPGGTTDFSARLIAEPLSKELGYPVVIDNKPGASGNIGNAIVAKANPDGHTLLLAYSGYQVANPHLFSTLAWHPVNDFTAVAMLTRAPQLITINPKLNVNTVAELVKYIQSHPEKLNYASSGVGSIQHIAGELLAEIAGAKMKHIPYKGTGPAMTDLLSGEVSLFITTPAGVLPHIKNGKLKALAVSGNKRLINLPNVPTMDELGYKNFNIESWFALYAPAKTPDAIVQRLQIAIDKILRNPDTLTKSEQAGTAIDRMSPQELNDYTKSEFAKWGDIIKKANIKLEN